MNDLLDQVQFEYIHVYGQFSIAINFKHTHTHIYCYAGHELNSFELLLILNIQKL